MSNFHTYIQDSNGTINMSAVGIDGKPVKKTKSEHPYNYDEFLVYGNLKDKANTEVYSDRLYEWDYKKFDEAAEKVFGNAGQFFGSYSAPAIEKFLQIYYDDDKLELVRYFEGCNQGNGYPFWVFCFNLSKK